MKVCTYCNIELNTTNTQTGQLLGNLFRLPVVPKNTPCCGNCYHRRFWWAWRILVSVICVIGLAATLSKGQWLAPLGIAPIFGVWWWISGKGLRAHPVGGSPVTPDTPERADPKTD